MDTVQVSARGVVVIPARIRKRLGIEEGSLLIVDAVDGVIRLRPAVAVPVERYSDVRAAEFILNNAVDGADYERARERVRQMGLDPDAITHEKPA